MKKEIIGILIFTLLFSVAVAPVINALIIEKNEINEVSKSNRIVNTPWPTLRHLEVICFGLISNLNKGGVYNTFNCVNVLVFSWDSDEEFHQLHYTDGEEISVPYWYRGILTKHFVLVRFDIH